MELPSHFQFVFYCRCHERILIIYSIDLIYTFEVDGKLK
jgi:hypothetical protein